MKVAVLGGLGLQGRAAIADLAVSAGVEEVVCVDTAPDGAARLAGLADLNRVRFVVPEGPIRPVLADVMRRVDAVVDLLPLPLMREAIFAAIETRTPLVTTNYAKSVADLATAAERSGVSIMFGMSLGVGYPASIVAQMLVRREIAQPGLLNPLAHVPDGLFLAELAKRGSPVTETITWDS
jgi:saccharopine dehydrogenase-like NADP-dependent oxidoreductase